MTTATATQTDALADFLREARTIAWMAADHGSWALYERLKAEYQRRFPSHDWREHEAVTLKLARIAGV